MTLPLLYMKATTHIRSMEVECLLTKDNDVSYMRSLRHRHKNNVTEDKLSVFTRKNFPIPSGKNGAITVHYTYTGGYIASTLVYCTPSAL